MCWILSQQSYTTQFQYDITRRLRGGLNTYLKSGTKKNLNLVAVGEQSSDFEEFHELETAERGTARQQQILYEIYTVYLSNGKEFTDLHKREKIAGYAFMLQFIALWSNYHNENPENIR